MVGEGLGLVRFFLILERLGFYSTMLKGLMECMDLLIDAFCKVLSAVLQSLKVLSFLNLC